MDKRQISVAEKETLARTDAKALILLGPSCPEVEELLAVGFKQEQIFGVDRDQVNCNYACKAFPKINVTCSEFAKFWREYGNQEKWGYIHLDYCGQARPSMIKQAIEVLDCIVGRGRLRVTFSGSLARLDRIRNEAFLLEQVISPISVASAGRAKLIQSQYYISSLSHKETYITAWWDRYDNSKERFF